MIADDDGTSILVILFKKRTNVPHNYWAIYVSQACHPSNAAPRQVAPPAARRQPPRDVAIVLQLSNKVTLVLEFFHVHISYSLIYLLICTSWEVETIRIQVEKNP